jgi:hypothetical protein
MADQGVTLYNARRNINLDIQFIAIHLPACIR